MNMKTLFFALVLTILVFLGYKFILNPQIVISQATQQCPSRWTFNSPLCSPNYETSCSPFDPSKLTKLEKINLIKNCGLQWN